MQPQILLISACVRSLSVACRTATAPPSSHHHVLTGQLYEIPQQNHGCSQKSKVSGKWGTYDDWHVYGM